MSFQHAPVTKGIMMALAASSVTVAIFDVKHYFHLQLVPHISRDHQYWRLPLHHGAFSNSSELFLCEFLLYNIGVSIERQFGGLKYASFLVVSMLLVTTLELLSLLALHRVGPSFNVIPSGPFGLAFSLLYQYFSLVPTTYQFRVLGATFSNKIFLYILALQLAFSQPWSTTIVAILGVLTGALYRSDIASLKSYRLPPWFVRLTSRYLLSIVGETRAVRRTNRALPVADISEVTPRLEDEVITTAHTPRTEPYARPTTGSGGAPEQAGPSVVREWVNELTGRVDRVSTGIRVPSEAEVAQLTSIFPDIQRDVIVAALQRR
ncbi:hypothetical protein B0F90DRAFT_513769 [Multifurca ochricompacta]|uniref:Peptidase S54 rhomboid domain-containing protein n=1 Tax=Multifurca ochricompacta TaxID=376703 RepID=A0AAD4MBL9_9AGAM|nr:hypothetical protein B0F90DRAFT_513769 [Multifurca ochricompacta]